MTKYRKVVKKLKRAWEGGSSKEVREQLGKLKKYDLVTARELNALLSEYEDTKDGPYSVYLKKDFSNLLEKIAV